MDGVVFLVDAEDKERFPEAKKELSVGEKDMNNHFRNFFQMRNLRMFLSLSLVTRLIFRMLLLNKNCVLLLT